MDRQYETSAIVGTNKFCWPGVISALTGMTTDNAEMEIQTLRRNDRPVTYAYSSEGLTVLRKHNWNCSPNLITKRMSLFFMLSTAMPEDGIYVTIVPSHVVLIVIEDRKVYFHDNHTKRPINAAGAARLGQTVKEMYRVVKV